MHRCVRVLCAFRGAAAVQHQSTPAAATAWVFNNSVLASVQWRQECQQQWRRAMSSSGIIEQAPAAQHWDSSCYFVADATPTPPCTRNGEGDGAGGGAGASSGSTHTGNGGNNLAVVLLNVAMPLLDESTFLPQLWRRAELRIAADGAADRLVAARSALQKRAASTTCTPTANDASKQLPVPHVLAGDMDSASPAAVESLEACGTEVLRDGDQNSNDLDKALTVVRDRGKAKGTQYRVLVYGGFGGRADHVLSNLSALYRWYFVVVYWQSSLPSADTSAAACFGQALL